MVFQRRAKANRLENVVDFVVTTMARAMAKTIERSLKEPVFIGVGVRITSWRMYNCNFFWGQDPLTEGALESPCQRGRRLLMARLTRKQRESPPRTGANPSDLDQTRSS